jgi:hypothetical protein
MEYDIEAGLYQGQKQTNVSQLVCRDRHFEFILVYTRLTVADRV